MARIPASRGQDWCNPGGFPVRDAADERRRPSTITVARVDIRLLGEIEVAVDGVVVTDARSPRLQAMIAYLALNRMQAVSRRAMASQFWPERAVERGLANLRRQLFELRQRWPLIVSCLRVDVDEMSWRHPERVLVDALEFEALALRAASEDDLRRALGLYRGVLLESVDDGWAQAARERLRGLQIQIARRLAGLLEEERRYADAYEALDSLTPLPADEPLCEQFLRLAVLSGGAARLERAYALVRQRFEREFEGAPTDGLDTCHRRLRQMLMAPRRGEPFVGRLREWRTLVQAWSSCCASGRPTLVWVQGESGIGKTALLREFRTWVGSSGARVFEGGAHGGGIRPLLAPVADALMGEEKGATAAPVPSDLRTLGPRALRARQFSVLLQALLAAVPALLTLDDMQDADEATWEWLRFALGAGAPTPIMIALATREGAPTTRRRQRLFHDLGGHVARSVIALRPLPPDDARWLVASSADLAEDIAEQVVELARGNPLFLLELTRLAAERPGAREALALGPTYEAVLGARLSSLRWEERRLLHAVAMLQRPTPRALLLKAVPTARPSTLDRLVDGRWIVAHDTATASLSHDLLRDPILQTLPPSRRRDLAARLALAASQAAGVLSDYQIAQLWEAAGRLDEARDAYRAASLRWERTLDLDDALSAYEALVRLSEPAERAPYHAGMAQALYARGEGAAARANYSEAITLALAHGRFDIAAKARMGFGRLLGEEGDGESALLHLRESAGFFRTCEDRRSLAEALVRLAEVFGYRADYGEASRLLREALDLARAVGDRDLEAECLNNLGFLEHEQGRFSKALELYGEARSIAEASGDAASVLMANGNIAVVHEELGHIRFAADFHWQTAELAHRHRLLHHLCYALSNVGVCYQDVGQWGEADRCVRAAYHLARGLGDQRAVGVITNLVAYALGQAGDVDGASRWWRQALTIAHAFGMPRYVALYTGGWAELLLDAGRVAQAASVLREGWRVRPFARELERVVLQSQYLRWACAAGRLGPDQAQRRLLEVSSAATTPQARAVGRYVTWQVTQRAADRARAVSSVADMIDRHPHVRWQSYYLALTGTVRALPVLDAPAAWLSRYAPTREDPAWDASSPTGYVQWPSRPS